jgi:uncharacterized protein
MFDFLFNPTPAPAVLDFGQTQSFLITGGTGFVGQHLVRALLAANKQVTVLSRNVGAAQRQLPAGVHCVDRFSADLSVDTVVNLAGARILGWPWTASRKHTLTHSRVGTTRQLLDWLSVSPNKPSRLLSASAIGYYGIQAANDPTVLTESSPTQPIFMSQICQAWEATAQEAKAHGVATTCLRFGLVLSRGGALPMMLLPIFLGAGGRLGSGQQSCSWVHIDDLIASIAHLCQQPQLVPAYNITAPECVSQLGFTQTAAKYLRRPSFFPTPGWLMRSLLGEQATLLLDGQRVAPQALLASGFGFKYPTLEGALKDLLG